MRIDIEVAMDTGDETRWPGETPYTLVPHDAPFAARWRMHRDHNRESMHPAAKPTAA